METKQPFETLVAQHGTVVWRVCRAVLSILADAEDAWSETFVTAMRAYPDLPDTADVQAWLVTIAHRKAVDVVRAASDGLATLRRTLTTTDPEGEDR